MIPALEGSRVVAKSCKDDRVVSVIDYSQSEQIIHLTLWDGDFCLDRVSLPLRKFLNKLGIPFHTDYVGKDAVLVEASTE